MKAVIMAGGYGTRLKPLTNNVPKPMVNIIDKPIMEYSIELLKLYGIKDIAVTLGYKPEIIKDYFKDGSEFGVHLTYFTEETPLGTAGSIKNAQSFFDDTFIVLSGDAFTNINLHSMINFHNSHKGLITIAVKDLDKVDGFGIVEFNESGKITSFLEKPENPTSHTVNTGIYILEKEVLDCIPQGKYDFGKELFPSLLGELFAHPTSEYWSDIGTLSSYYLTNNFVALNPQKFNIIL